MMALVSEQVFTLGKNYKGIIRYAKLELSGGRYKIEKRRVRKWGYQSVSVNKAEFDYATDYNKAAALWAYWDGGISCNREHPITKERYYGMYKRLKEQSHD